MLKIITIHMRSNVTHFLDNEVRVVQSFAEDIINHKLKPKETLLIITAEQ